MDNKQVVKNSILMNKISEYFAKNPDKQSVVIKADLGERKLFWRAVREGKQRFHITEVNTATNQFICEAKCDMPNPPAPDPEKKMKGKKKKKDVTKKAKVKSKKFLTGAPPKAKALKDK